MVTAKCFNSDSYEVWVKFGALWYSKAHLELGFKNLSEITERIKSFDVDFIASLIKVGHITYCQENKSQPISDSVEYYYGMIDACGLIECVQAINIGIVELTGVNRLSSEEIDEVSKKK